VAMSAAVPPVADQVPERCRHAGPHRRGELPEQPAFEDLCAYGRRFEEQGGQVGVCDRRGLQLRAIQLEDLH
jgi:hypothetical protein